VAPTTAMESTVIDVMGIPLEVSKGGTGRDILFLNSGSWLADDRSFADDLVALGHVVAPTHPGFGLTDTPARLTCVDDLAYLYLDLIDAMDLNDVLLVGASFGGWIAAEMMVKGAGRVSALALINPLGLKAGTRDERDFVDVFATPDREIEARSFTQPADFHRNIRTMADDEATRRVRSREALARFGWSPYMHDPKLPGRLHRIAAPTLVLRGEADRMVAPRCAERYAELIPNARLEVVKDTAHFTHLEQPRSVIERLADMQVDTAAATRTRETA
jgi:pimeloyl-ACP methyl ester carboxylesterase